MTLENLRDYLNYVIDITKNGNKLTPTNFNLLLKNYFLPYFRIKVKEYTTGQLDDTNKSKLFYDLLVSLLSSPTNVTITGGDGSLPVSFGAWNNAYGTYGGVRKEIELISERIYTERMNNILSSSFQYFPACVIRGSTLTVYPNNINPVTLLYYTKPAQPIYDYYINAAGKEVYTAEGVTSISVPAGGKSSAGVAGPTTVNSLTVELDFPEDLHEDFAKYLLSVMGIKTGDINMVQYAEQLKQQP